MEVTIPDLGLSRVGHATALTSELAHNIASELKDGLRSRYACSKAVITLLSCSPQQGWECICKVPPAHMLQHPLKQVPLPGGNWAMVWPGAG